MEVLFQLKQMQFTQDLENLGAEIFVVGGIVRDHLIGRPSKDIDLVIRLIPMEQLIGVLEKHGSVDLVGKSFGIIKFVPTGWTDEAIDIALPRTERKIGIGHQGFDVNVDHTMPLEEDLKRRDFTLNAMAVHLQGGLIDPFGGLNDLNSGVISVITDQSFTDDPLRMLRAIQFCARFEMRLCFNTHHQMIANKELLREISGERILIEFDKIFEKATPDGKAWATTMMRMAGLFPIILGHELPYLEGGMHLAKTRGDFYYLMLRGGRPVDELYTEVLRGDVDTAKDLKATAFLKTYLGVDPIENRLLLSKAYKISPRIFDSGLFEDVKEFTELRERKYPRSITEMEINGDQLKEMGYVGVDIGIKLSEIQRDIYSDKIPNEYSAIAETCQRVRK